MKITTFYENIIGQVPLEIFDIQKIMSFLFQNYKVWFKFQRKAISPVKVT